MSDMGVFEDYEYCEYGRPVQDSDKIAAYDKIAALLHDDLYSDSKDWQAGDIVEQVEWLLSLYESKKKSEALAWEKLAEANELICEMNEQYEG